MKKHLSILLCIILILTGSVSAVNLKYIEPLTKGDILYVGGTGPGNYTQIQDAIDNASDGDTVFVYNDSSPYYENLFIDKSINLIGEDSDNTVIDGCGNKHVIWFQSDNIRLAHFSITNGKYGIWLNSSRCIVENNNIFFNLVQGIKNSYYFSHGHSNIIANNTFTDHPYELLVLGSPDNYTIRDNFFSYSGGAHGNNWGVYLHGNTINNKIIGNTFELSEFAESTAGLYTEANVFNNTFSNNIFSKGNVGIQIGGGAYNTFTNNVFKNQSLMGLGIRYSRKSIVANNIFMENELGLIFGRSNLNDIIKNSFINNTKHADIRFLSLYNRWQDNYWNRARLFPYPIIGKLTYGFEIKIPWINVDWHPAQEPYPVEWAG